MTRAERARVLAGRVSDWLPAEPEPDGRLAYQVPSSSGAGYYRVTASSCTCPAFAIPAGLHGDAPACYHVLAAQLFETEQVAQVARLVRADRLKG